MRLTQNNSAVVGPIRFKAEDYTEYPFEELQSNADKIAVDRYRDGV